MHRDRLHTFQQDCSFAQGYSDSRLEGRWLLWYITLNLRLLCSSNINSIDYYVWDVAERETNKYPNYTNSCLKDTITTAINNMNEQYLIQACSSFPSQNCKYGLGSIRITPREGTPPIGPGPTSGQLAFNYNQPIPDCVSFYK